MALDIKGFGDFLKESPKIKKNKQWPKKQTKFDVVIPLRKRGEDKEAFARIGVETEFGEPFFCLRITKKNAEFLRDALSAALAAK